MATKKVKEEPKYIEKTIAQMSDKEKKTFFRTLISVFSSVLVICMLAINMFSCKMDSKFEMPEVPVDYMALLTNSSYQPVSQPSWSNVPSCMLSVTQLDFLEQSDNRLLVRITCSETSEEGSFVLSEDASGTLTIDDCSFSVHIAQDGSIRLINSYSESLDFSKSL